MKTPAIGAKKGNGYRNEQDIRNLGRYKNRRENKEEDTPHRGQAHLKEVTKDINPGTMNQ